jgi:response regulator NasT
VVDQLARTPCLRVALVDADKEAPELLGEIVERLGHEVVARHDLGGRAIAQDDPDVAIASVTLDSTDALELLDRIVDDAICPVVAVLRARSPEYVRAAATLGVFAVIVDDRPENLSSALDVTLQRFIAYRARHGASGPRAAVEQARGILMAHHDVAARQADEMLRQHAEVTGQTLVSAAAALVSAHPLLVRYPLQD